MTIILGLDPSLSCTGWGVIRAEGSRLSHIANGQIATDAKAPIPERLAQLQRELSAVIAQHAPERAACEEVFVNKNPQSTLKLAQARGAVLAACGAAGLAVREHAARSVKKAVVGTGAAEKAAAGGENRRGRRGGCARGGHRRRARALDCTPPPHHAGGNTRFLRP